MKVAVIGGTGVDEMAQFTEGKPVSVTTRFGEAAVIQSSSNPNILFLPRHGLTHTTPPAQINYRAQTAALKKLAVTRVIAMCAVGSLRPEIPEGSLAVLGDFIDLTRHRHYTFFDDAAGPLVHTDFTHPYCPAVSRALVEACEIVGAKCSPSVVYVGVDGPRYETPSEIRLYASWGGDVIGMTNIPEVVLAKEAGLCYGAIGVVTNLAAGLGLGPLGHDDVRASVATAEAELKAVIEIALTKLASNADCLCQGNTSLVV